MVKRGAGVLLALFLWGCPDDIGNVMNGAVIGLRAPGDLDGVPNGGSEVLLTWKDRAAGESGYRVEMNPVPFGTPVIGGVEYLPADATTTAFPVFPNSTYYFRVFAVTSVMESDPSNVVVVTTPDVPPRPTGVLATPVSSTQINLTWIDVGGEIGYTLEMSTNGADWIPAVSVSANVTSSARTGLAPDSEYYLRVIAQGANGPSTPSLPVRAQTLAAVTPAVVFNPDAGLFTSYVVTDSGAEHLALFEVVSGKPLYINRTYPGSYQATTIENGPPQVGGDGTSLAVDGAGKVHVVAHNLTNDTLRYFTNASGNWVAATIDPKFAGGKPRIVWDPATGWLHAYVHARWSMNSPVIVQTWKAPGQPWVVADEPLPAEVDHAATFSVAVDAAGNRHIAVVMRLQGLRVVHDTGIPGPGGSSYQPEDLPLPAGARPDFTAIAAGAAGQLHVVYHDSSSGGLHHATKISGSWVIEDIDVVAGQDLGTYCSLAIHPPTGRLHVAYYDATNRDLRYARKDPGGAWVRKVFDVVGDVGSHASISIDAAGAVHVAYRDATSLRLRIATGSP